mgnify:CR=1 FL=1
MTVIDVFENQNKILIRIICIFTGYDLLKFFFSFILNQGMMIMMMVIYYFYLPIDLGESNFEIMIRSVVKKMSFRFFFLHWL